MEIKTLELFTKYKKKDGFFVKPGFIYFKTKNGIEFYTNGIIQNDFLFVYRKVCDNQYKIKLLDCENPIAKTIKSINKSYFRNKRRNENA